MWVNFDPVVAHDEQAASRKIPSFTRAGVLVASYNFNGTVAKLPASAFTDAVAAGNWPSNDVVFSVVASVSISRNVAPGPGTSGFVYSSTFVTHQLGIAAPSLSLQGASYLEHPSFSSGVQWNTQDEQMLEVTRPVIRLSSELSAAAAGVLRSDAAFDGSVLYVACGSFCMSSAGSRMWEEEVLTMTCRFACTGTNGRCSMRMPTTRSWPLPSLWSGGPEMEEEEVLR